MRPLSFATLILFIASSVVAGCGNSDDDDTGGGTTKNTSDGPTLVGDWVLELETGENEIDMTSTSAGHAQLWWYDFAESQWDVTATDDGSGSAELTLSCTSSDCSDADPIVMDCSYTLTQLKCVGLSGGIMDNYVGPQNTLTKE